MAPSLAYPRAVLGLVLKVLAGPLARVGPDELITDDPALLRKMMAVRSLYTRGPWYNAVRFDPDRDNILSMRNDNAHTILRSKMAAGYSGKENESMEETVDRQIQKFIDLIERKYISTSKDYCPMDLGFKAQYFTLDIISDLAFGKSFGYMENDDDVFDYIKIVEKSLPTMMVLANVPVLTQLVQTKMLRSLLPKESDRIGFGAFIRVAKKLVAERFKPGAEPQKDMIGSFIRHGLTQEEVAGEALVQVIAGSDTSAATIRFVFLNLFSTPSSYQRLLAEIDSAIATGKISSPIKDSEGRELPYLQAVIKETLRVNPPASAMFSKLVPTGGDTIHGMFVPEGTQIGGAMYSMQHSKKIFGQDADVFRPERWLEAEGDQLAEMTSTADLVFHYGKYQCLGKMVALMELNKIFVELLRRFDFAICIRGRRICDGYLLEVTDSGTPRLEPLSISTSIFGPNVIRTLLKTDQERRCFDYFRHRAAPELSGSFESPFWNQLLLQASYHEPAILHAVLALGSAHEKFEQRLLKKTKDDDGFALKQYVKAIGFVLRPIRQQSKQAADVTLIACILFVCFEALRAHHHAALSHIEGGLKIISDLQSSQTNSVLTISPSPYVPLSVLIPIFAVLEGQANQLSTDRHYLQKPFGQLPNPGDLPDVPSSFQNFEEARTALYQIRNRPPQTVPSLPTPPSPLNSIHSSPTAEDFNLFFHVIGSGISITRSKQWKLAFDNLLQARKKNLSKLERRRVQILKLLSVIIDIHLNIDYVRAMDDEMIWDNYTDKFETVVKYSEELLQSTEDQKHPTFTLDVECSQPLFFVAIKCRHGKIRRKAITLLQQQQRQEGIWNTLGSAMAAERMMKIEEEGLDGAAVLPSDIPRSKRVVNIEVKLDDEQKKAIVQYVRLKGDGEVEKARLIEYGEEESRGWLE
ncbi:hypothetical protein B7494_g353 [Chlorociboria aeruginascens]|nr:hypothetical protein B7494_g353 [Chlorociboria aeruginascens]